MSVYFLIEVLFLHMFDIVWQMDIELNIADLTQGKLEYIILCLCTVVGLEDLFE